MPLEAYFALDAKNFLMISAITLIVMIITLIIINDNNNNN